MLALGNTELSDLIALMHAMNELAKAGDWQKLERLDKERRALLQYEPATDYSTAQDASLSEAAVDREPTANDSPERKAMIEQIKTLDKQILSSAQQARQKLLDENHELSERVKAKNLYAQTSLIG